MQAAQSVPPIQTCYILESPLEISSQIYEDLDLPALINFSMCCKETQMIADKILGSDIGYLISVFNQHKKYQSRFSLYFFSESGWKEPFKVAFVVASFAITTYLGFKTIEAKRQIPDNAAERVRKIVRIGRGTEFEEDCLEMYPDEMYYEGCEAATQFSAMGGFAGAAYYAMTVYKNFEKDIPKWQVFLFPSYPEWRFQKMSTRYQVPCTDELGHSHNYEDIYDYIVRNSKLLGPANVVCPHGGHRIYLSQLRLDIAGFRMINYKYEKK